MKTLLRKRGSLDILAVLVFPALASYLSFQLEASAFASILLFFGLPAVYLSVRNTNYVKKAAIFSLCTSIPAIVVIDYIAHLTGQWVIPNSALPWRLFDYVSIEVVLWAFLNFYAVILFYEFFLNQHHTNNIWNYRGKYLLLFILGVCLSFLTIFFAQPSALAIPYFYLLFGITLILLPVAKELSSHPNLIKNFSITAAYFFYLSFLYEVTALKLDWWHFPSKEFIGHVTVLDVTFPFEELVFWFLLFSMAILTFYEHYTGNEKKA